MSIIVYTGTSARYIDMAEPNRMECVPMSDGLKPNLTSPMDAAATLSALDMSVLEICWSFLMAKKALTYVSGVDLL